MTKITPLTGISRTGYHMMPIEDYDLILGVDWMSKHGARGDCKNKTVQFVRSGRDVLVFQAIQTKERKFLIVRNKVRKMLANG
jgi:hypothetical protein